MHIVQDLTDLATHVLIESEILMMTGTVRLAISEK